MLVDRTLAIRGCPTVFDINRVSVPNTYRPKRASHFPAILHASPAVTRVVDVVVAPLGVNIRRRSPPRGVNIPRRFTVQFTD